MRFSFISNKTELTKYIFVSLCLQEVDLIREQVQKLVSLPMWMCLLPVNITAFHVLYELYILLSITSATFYKMHVLQYFMHCYILFSFHGLLHISCMAAVRDVWKWLQILWLFRPDCSRNWRRSQNCRSSGTSLKRTMRRWSRRIWSSKKQPHAPQTWSTSKLCPVSLMNRVFTERRRSAPFSLPSSRSSWWCSCPSLRQVNLFIHSSVSVGCSFWS